jgi:ubiquinone biosynthesis protein UbiJ
MVKFSENTTIAQISRVATLVATTLTVISIVGGLIWTQRAQVIFLTSFAERLDRDVVRLDGNHKEKFSEISSIVTRQAEVAQALLGAQERTGAEVTALRRELDGLSKRIYDLERERRQ